ncbi:MAG: PAS domain-containing sensor histidine kinase [Anaeromyxobacter sp. RBG_16_69_14]|nr:MAG: PAS domain-containing sensor histidine kinase [Anaeromyxobacter sp. RBG_16_69_14]
MADPPLRIAQPEDLDPLGDALSAFGIGMTLVDRGMQVRWANGWILGMARELSCGGSHCFSAMWKSSQRCPDCLPLLVFRTGEAQEGVRERGRPGAPVEAYRVRAVPVVDAAGELRWAAESFVRLSGLGVASDLASGLKSLASEAAAASSAALVVVDAQERIVSWGPAAVEVFGWALDEALGRRIDLLVPAERLDEERAIAERVAREGRFPRTETVRCARDGRLVPVALSAVALRDEAGAFIGRSCTFEDLSVLHQLRGRLAAQEQLLAHVTREAADAILGVGRDGCVTGFNRAAEGLLGLGAGEALGRPLAEVAGDPAATALLGQVEREKVVRGVRAAWRRADGEVPVEVSAALLAGGGVALVARDVSGQLELERRMMRSEKLAVVGSLAAGLAHEIGTPLNVISATAEYLMVDGAPGERARRLREIVGETDRISRLVRELLAFARGSGAERALVDVPAAVSRVLSLLAIPAEKKRVRVEADLPATLPPVLADPDGLHQVLVNLLVNAVSAVGDGGRVGVRARTGPDGAHLALEVHDDGPGVPEALRERVFDPFFTTRPDGTGLGLAVCARIVAAHGGDLRVGAGPLGGACFSVLLPVAPEAGR